MAHPFFSQEEEVSFDPHSKRDTPLPASRAARNDKQQEGGANRRSISCGPTAELDGKTRPVSTRRRTPVAVSFNHLLPLEIPLVLMPICG